MMKRMLISLAFAVAALPTVAQAQLPENILAEIRAIGRVVEAQRTAALFDSQHYRMPQPGIQAERDIAYGTDPLQKLDVFTKANDTATNKAVVIFAHGGGFTGGDKHRDGAFQYDHLMMWLARNDMVGVNINYRLAPASPFPAAQEDLAAAIRWTKANITRYGGDPNRIVLAGQSAGASLVANHLAMRQFHGPDGHGAVAAYLSSGQYEVSEPSPYYGNDRARFAERSSLNGMARIGIPMFITIAEFDPPEIAEQGQKLNKAMCDAGKCPNYFLTTDGHNHNSQIYAIGTSDQTVSRPLRQFLQNYTRR
jgi:triacylglycerol lipase